MPKLYEATRLGFCCNEALALECAYQRRLTEKLSERLSALEAARP